MKRSVAVEDIKKLSPTRYWSPKDKHRGSFIDWLKYSWEEIEAGYNAEWVETVNKIAESNIPNECFFQYFRRPYRRLPQEWAWLKQGQYWTAIAYIMIKRGLPKIADLKKDVLEWYQDPTYYSSYAMEFMEKFIVENGEAFLPDVAETFLTAYHKRDCNWMVFLLDHCYKEINSAMTEEQVEKLDELIDYLYNDEPWLDLEERYSSLVYEISFYW